MRLLLATSNQGKIKELLHLLQSPSLQLLGLHDLPPLPPCDEDRSTFIGNATKKARHFARLTNLLTLADDSGLCVDALHGAPGVLSARYAGITGHDADQANNQKLMAALQNTPDPQRTARFTCAIALASPDADLAAVQDSVEGTLLHHPRGTNGFGYDPFFLIPHLQKTTAELDLQTKNQLSHRGKALQHFLPILQRFLSV